MNQYKDNMSNLHLNKNTVTKDYTKDDLFDELGLKRLKESYMHSSEKSPQDRFAHVSEAFGSSPEHSQRLYNYASKHWLSYSTPILSWHETAKGQPISCFLNYIEDTAKGLVDNLSETNWLSMLGGGVGVHFQIRNSDSKSVGVMPHIKTYDTCSQAYKQGSRRGSYAAYLDISHPDIIPFLEMRKVTGDQNLKALNMNHGVNIPDSFMQILERCMLDKDADDSWDLISPNTGLVQETVSAKALWMKLLELRMQTGEPYIWFIDEANRGVPEFQKKLGLKNHGSNLCSEISLVTDVNRTAVCCLSSLNLEYFDDWKDDKLFIADVLEMLDNVLEHFIQTAPDSISRAKFSAYRERSVGVGALGWHAYLQKNNIAFEGVVAKGTNIRIFKHIKTKLDEANVALALSRGACPDAAESGVMLRFAHTSAIAPNASSSIIMGNTSPSVEPYSANAYRQDTTSGAFITKNKFLDKLIKERALTESDPAFYDDTWAAIIADDGSVQSVSWLSENEKYVYKTAREIDQRWIIEHASDRQQFIDQAASTNLFFNPDVSIKYLHAVHFMAWKSKLKSLYYLRSSKLRKADKVGTSIVMRRIEDEINLKAIVEDTSCIACEG
jgi:ribonucleoside-diphosphate reductase alpha chain